MLCGGGVRFLVLTTVLSSTVSAVRRPPGLFRRWDLPPPIARRDAGNVTTDWLEQKLDHYNPTITTTWQQRYFVNTNFYKDSGPAFLFISGESSASEAWVRGGHMMDLAAKFGAMAFELEHRFYGDSHPTESLSSANLHYLRTDNALADVAYFIETMNTKYALNDATKWIVFGGSYAGNLAAWARLKFPHLVHGAVSSSAPVFAETDFTGYYEVVGSVLNASSPQCYQDVKNATQELQNLLNSEEGAQEVTKLFNLCQPLDLNAKNDIYNLQNTMAEIFAGFVQYNSYSGSEVQAVCNQVTDPRYGGTPLKRYSSLAPHFNCLDVRFSSLVQNYGNDSWDANPTYRAWIYQTCSEYGYYQTTDSPNQPFSKGFPLEFFIDQCAALYGKEFNKDLVDSAVQRTNLLYGGRNPQVTNVVFVNGGSDPWHVLGVLEDLSPSAQAVVIDGFSHCGDMYTSKNSDPPQMKAAHAKIAALIQQWLD
ncbi:putative serine protease K12H4.7 [Anabrus simplex]|uniref:putative serine protease K12H4.7 n=1 Tax=Anabrus simplex TaxID=316456 RepID=UPI0035A32E55